MAGYSDNDFDYSVDFDHSDDPESLKALRQFVDVALHVIGESKGRGESTDIRSKPPSS